jgi:hypothetical protein
MTEHTASRTLVKSPPELWAECSDAAALTRHLDHFGEIRITRLEPETAVAWEGELVRGTVRLEPSGWGTKVTLTAKLEDIAGAEAPEVVPEPEPEPVALEPEPVALEPEPVAVEPQPQPEPVESVGPPAVAQAPPAPAPEKRPGMFARLIAMLVGKPEPEPETVLRELTAELEPDAETEPVAEPEPAVEPEPVAESAPVPVPEPEPEAPSLAAELADAESALVAALDSLGQAHHRPFSRG